MSAAGTGAAGGEWDAHERAWALVSGELGRFVERCAPAAELSAALRERAGVRLVDVVDFVQLARAEGFGAELRLAGFVKRACAGIPAGAECYAHAGAGLPTVVLAAGGVTRVAVGVERVEDALAAWGVEGAHVEGEEWAAVRRARAAARGENELWAVERHGGRGLAASAADPARSVRMARHFAELRGRARAWEDPFRGLEHAARLVDAAVADLGRDGACDVFFRAERAYWESRCAAGRARRARQEEVGIGWANHDHHTLRASRRCCAETAELLERLGLTARDRSWRAGAGGAIGCATQAFVNAEAGVAVELEVDATEDEAGRDFTREALGAHRELGEAGLWCALHGESALEAGLCALGVRGVVGAGMEVFTELPGLRRAYEGEEEMWEVEGARVEALVERGRLTGEEAEMARGGGASGGRVEVVERG